MSIKEIAMNNKGNELVLYHGSPDKQIVPTYGLGNDKHDYGKGEMTSMITEKDFI